MLIGEGGGGEGGGKELLKLYENDGLITEKQREGDGELYFTRVVRCERGVEGM
jgi:hypothetical protein